MIIENDVFSSYCRIVSLSYHWRSWTGFSSTCRPVALHKGKASCSFLSHQSTSNLFVLSLFMKISQSCFLKWLSLSYVRHQRFFSLLDRFRATVAEDTTSPVAPITTHPLDGDPPPPPENVEPNKVWLTTVAVSWKHLSWNITLSLLCVCIAGVVCCSGEISVLFERWRSAVWNYWAADKTSPIWPKHNHDLQGKDRKHAYLLFFWKLKQTLMWYYCICRTSTCVCWHHVWVLGYRGYVRIMGWFYLTLLKRWPLRDWLVS